METLKKQKRKDTEEIQGHIQAFIKTGGKITIIESGLQKFDPQKPRKLGINQEGC